MRTYRLALISASLLLIGSLALSIASPAFGDAMKDGNTAYKAADYAAAITAFKQAVADDHGVKQARAYYKLGLSYEKTGDLADAAASYQAAKNIDPSLSFARNRAGFERKLARTQRIAAGGQDAGPDGAAKALATDNVFVDAGVQGVDKNALEAVATEGSRTHVKVAVLSALPSWYLKFAADHGYDSLSALVHFTVGLHKHLDLKRNALVVICQTGLGAGVGIQSSDLKPEVEAEIANRYNAKIQAGDLSQIAPLCRDVVHAVDGVHTTKMLLLSAIVLIIVLFVIFTVVRQARVKAAQMAALRAPVQALKQMVESNIEYVDGYVPALPKNNADTDQIRAYRQAAAAKLEQATKIIGRAVEPRDLNRAKTLLEAALKDCQQARRYLDRVTGGTASIPGDAAIRPAEIEDVAAIPEKERGVSFFSSRPAPVKKLVPVTINVDGVDRQVLATPSEAADIARGQIPAVRSFQINGRTIPWYMYDGYDPYRDYWEYQRCGWANLDAGLIAGFIGAEMLDSLFSRPAYTGSFMSPYGYAPGWDSWGYWDTYDQGYFDAPRLQAQEYAFSDPYTNPAMGGAAFSGAGYDQSDYGAPSNQGGGAGAFGGDNS